MGKSKPRDKRLFVAGGMPPLYHSCPGEKYNPKKSEVLKWISERPSLLTYTFDKLVQSGQIEYNSDTGKWQGVDYDGD
ncbi:hypothetical protein ACG0Z4_27790 [Enterocloster aldenensis]|uniref:hypothetical protein n=1 Tax=Enterocloster aldenensis TaxID=358742 RepID=UPI004029D22E